MREHELSPAKGSKRRRKRLGRGLSSGFGTYAGKGMKGQKARSGVRIRPGFEGGQNPLIKSLPRQRGFRNRFRVEYQVVNLQSLDRFEAGAQVTPAELLRAGLVRNLKTPIKILAEGELGKALNLKANKFSASAKEKIAAAGGTAEEIGAADAAV